MTKDSLIEMKIGPQNSNPAKMKCWKLLKTVF